MADLNKKPMIEIRIHRDSNTGMVIVAFAEEVAWIGLPPDSARALANALLSQVDNKEGLN